MIGLYISLGVLAVLFVAYLVLLAPNGKRGKLFADFEKQHVAHRGFFNNEGDAPENSLLAFELAVANSYGIELDVQLTSDQKLVVFHDDDLARMCGVDKKVEDCTFDELQQYCLAKSQQKIPLFTDALAVIGGKVPLIVEIKNSQRWQLTCQLTAQVLDGYAGVYCVESFSPLVVHWFKKNRPHVIRGQLSTNYFKDNARMPFFTKFVLTNLLFNGIAKPDFVAYNHKHKNQFSYKLLRKLYRVKNVAWTVKSQQELEDASDVFTCMIFDSFTPSK